MPPVHFQHAHTHQAVVELQAEAGDFPAVLEIRVEKGSPCRQLLEDSLVGLFCLWQKRPPKGPKRTIARHFFTIFADAGILLSPDALGPPLAIFRCVEKPGTKRGVPKNVEVMNFA